MTDQRPPSGSGSKDCGSFFLDICGQFIPEQLRVSWSDQVRPSNEKLDALIDEAWSRETGKAEQTGRRLFNGQLCRLIHYGGSDQFLELTIGPVGYKEFIGTNLTQAYVRYVHGPDVMADPLGVSTCLTTTDGFLLLGKRSKKVAYHAERIHPFGGMVEPRKDGTVPSPFQRLLAEVHEETNVSSDMVGECVCVGLVRDKHIVQPELIFDTKVTADLETIRELSKDASDIHEHTEMVPVLNHPAAVVTFIEKRFNELTGIALAVLLLHGLRSWGSGWFASARGYLRSVV